MGYAEDSGVSGRQGLGTAGLKTLRGDDFKRDFTAQRGKWHRCGAHLTYGLTLAGLRRTRISLGGDGSGQWEVEQRPA
jgi:hypothetical protein